MLGAFAALGVSAAARGDDVKLGGFWIPATIQEISDGNLVYQTRGEPIKKPLSEVQGIRLTGNDALTDAEDLLAEQLYADALEDLQDARRGATTSWARHWIDHRIVTTADKAGKPNPAVSAYLQLAASDADPYFLRHIPARSVAGASDTEKKLLQTSIQNTLQRIRDDDRKAGVERLLKIVKGEKVDTTATVENGGGEMVADGTVDVSKSAVIMPRNIPADPIGKALAAGEFKQALELVEATLQERTRGEALSLRLYEKGLALQNLAEAGGDEGQYKSAGLAFMRVVIYFPASPYAGAAWMEAGQIHHAIGRRDLAAYCYEQAGLYIVPDEEPVLNKRLEDLRRKLQDDPDN